MTKKPKSSRRVNPSSVIHVKKAHRAKDYGPYFNDNLPWTNDQIDLLYEGFLVHGWRMEGLNDCFHSKLGRTKDAITTMLWKAVVRYSNPQRNPKKDPEGDFSAARRYSPLKRTNRTNQPFTDRDKALLDIWLRKGQEYSGGTLEHLAATLGRSTGDVQGYLFGLVVHYLRRYPTLNVWKVKLISDLERLDQEEISKIVKEVLKGHFDKVKRRFF